MLDAGLPEGVYNLVTGPGGTLGDALVKHPLVERVAFTASTAVGQSIVRNGAATMKHTTMELGGKSPNIIFRYHPNAPFGGYKLSGYGREQGAEVLESYTQYETIWANLG